VVKTVAVRVIPRARRRAVEPQPGGGLLVRVAEPPEDGRANDAVIEALAEHFGVRRSAVRIIRGGTARRKVVEIAG
jgi:hypothetical protein